MWLVFNILAHSHRSPHKTTGILMCRSQTALKIPHPPWNYNCNLEKTSTAIRESLITAVNTQRWSLIFREIQFLVHQSAFGSSPWQKPHDHNEQKIWYTFGVASQNYRCLDTVVELYFELCQCTLTCSCTGGPTTTFMWSSPDKCIFWPELVTDNLFSLLNILLCALRH